MIAQDLKVKNLLIWHTEDQTGIKRKERYSAEAKQFYEGNVWVPEDGEVFDISDMRGLRQDYQNVH